ncbi:hypothetical protein A6770_30220 [Nostoc minutum NIES-26]|uniref:Uncharacterized protein n=1 Tax=Nostoc minutum NIES-26 TaxID=1844469 RepID=A0A367QEG4_9NOSO|nr:hypothetical protein A6770_30220 [Nostoc minutum NIES-26]
MGNKKDCFQDRQIREKAKNAVLGRHSIARVLLVVDALCAVNQRGLGGFPYERLVNLKGFPQGSKCRLCSSGAIFEDKVSLFPTPKFMMMLA